MCVLFRLHSSQQQPIFLRVRLKETMIYVCMLGVPHWLSKQAPI